MLGFVGEVALDLAGLLVNPDAEPSHPLARAAVLAALAVALAAGLAVICAEDGAVML